MAPFCEELPAVIWDKIGKAQIYMLRDCYQCRYVLSPDYESNSKCWLAGPYITEEPTMHEIIALCKNLRLPADSFRFFQSYYRMLPKLLDKNMFETLLRAEAALRYGGRGFELVPWDMGSEDILPISEDLEKGSRTPSYVKFIEHNYTVEYEMMTCIAQGNYHGAMALYSKLQGNGLDAKVESTLRNGKNSLIVLNTLCRMAGYNGGVHSDKLDMWAREFIVQIESKTRFQELRPLRNAMIKKYCELVRMEKGPAYSPIIQKAVDHISGTFTGSVSLSSTAKLLNISTSYLSALFKREVGVPFTDYVLEKRLSFAKELLQRTNLSVSSIAVECGIPDNNYFARIFKAHTGLTPIQYRSNLA